MSKRITVVVSQGQSLNPAKRGLEEDVVAGLLTSPGIDVTVIPHLYDLRNDGTGALCLQGVSGDMVVLAWMFPRANRWVLDSLGVHGLEGTSLLVSDDDSGDEEEADEAAIQSTSDGDRVSDSRPVPNRRIYCIDMRVKDSATEYIAEIERIANEVQTNLVELTSWIQGSPKPEQLDRYLNGTAMPSSSDQSNEGTSAGEANEVVHIQDDAPRRWYPVIDYSRCTNCLECIDFCLFGVYGVDKLDTILVEQQDNCRKGCPACSRVCPENAIIFPQHKSPGIAGSNDAVAGLKIDLSKLFGKPDEEPVQAAVRERDEQLLLAGRQTVGMAVGIPKRQPDTDANPKDDLDNLIDEVDGLDL